ncbi:DnaB-like helicase [Vibrio phage LV6]|nr:DnaB-like helicase [Vibrio phage LV6]
MKFNINQPTTDNTTDTPTSGVILGAAKKVNAGDLVQGAESTGKYQLGAKKQLGDNNLSLQLIAILLETADTQKYHKYRLPVSCTSGSERDLYEAIDGYLLKYYRLPNADELKDYAQSLQLPEMDLPAITTSYGLDLLQDKVLADVMALRSGSAISKFLDGQADHVPVTDRLRDLSHRISKIQRLDPRNATSNISALAQTSYLHASTVFMSPHAVGVRLGWEGLDQEMNGLTKGNVLTLIGRPSAGKSWCAFYAALQGYHQHKRTMVVTIEMPEQEVFNRFMAMEAGIEYSKIAKKGTSTNEQKRLRKARDMYLEQEEDPEGKRLFILANERRITVSEIINECIKNEIEFLVIDAAYLVKHDDPRINQNAFDRIRNVAEEIKLQIAAALQLAVVCTYQFKREVDKYSSHEDLDLDDIYGGDTVGQVSSVVIGIWDDTTPDGLGTRYMKILKGREGEKAISGFRINWDFERMDFSDYKEPEISSFDGL